MFVMIQQQMKEKIPKKNPKESADKSVQWMENEIFF